MPPPNRTVSQNNRTSSLANLLPKGVVTRSRQSLTLGGENQSLKKRRAESPLKKNTKRSAFGDLTNAIGKSTADTKKVLKNVTNTSTKAPRVFKDIKKPVLKKEATKTAVQRASSFASQPSTRKGPVPSAAASKPKLKDPPPPTDVLEPRKTRLSSRLSLETTSSENSLYVSALEDIGDEAVFPDVKTEQEQSLVSVIPPRRTVPPGVTDFDAENANDPFQVSDYVMDIFEYLKDRESLYKVGDYMEKQVSLSRWMRSLLVDWMVEVQENFELNHETLYLAVKIVDLYLSKVIVGKERLQLVGAAALFVSSKFDERVPPLIDDLIYICDGAYSPDELIKMEVNILKEINFDLSMPLSYRFLRRYARCAKMDMPQMTLARYILELSLMDYSMVFISESKIAAAALLLAIKMQNLGDWTPTLEYYSGYKLEDIKDICLQLNEMLHKKPKPSLATVRNKYSHKVFFEVAKIPLVSLDF